MRAVAACVVVLSVSVAVRAGSKEERARLDVTNLTKAAEAYQKAKGNPPAKLSDLVTAGYVEPKATLLDPWGNPYQYDPNGTKNGGRRPDIWAVDPDKKLIGNWPEEKK
jgi:type II secretory pathway pseudopilin PulG